MIMIRVATKIRLSLKDINCDIRKLIVIQIVSDSAFRPAITMTMKIMMFVLELRLLIIDPNTVNYNS